MSPNQKWLILIVTAVALATGVWLIMSLTREPNLAERVAAVISRIDEISQFEINEAENELSLLGKPGSGMIADGQRLEFRWGLIKEMFNEGEEGFEQRLEELIKSSALRLQHGNTPILAEAIVPLIREVGYLSHPIPEEFAEAMTLGTPIDYGKANQIAEHFVDQLFIAYWADTGNGFSSFTLNRAPEGRRDLASIRELAIKNLSSKLGKWRLIELSSSKIAAISADRHALVLSVLLLPEARSTVQKIIGKRLAVGLPTAYELLVANADDPFAVAELRTATRNLFGHDVDKPQSDQVYEWTVEGLIPLKASGTMP